MRILLTGLPIRSHLIPAVVPVAQALQNVGHDVAIATGRAMAAELEQRGIPVVVLPDVLAPEEAAAKLPPGLLDTLRQWRPEVSGVLSVPIFVEDGTTAFARNLLDSGWQPELIIRETNEYGGFLAASVLGVPLATIDIAPLITRLVPDLLERLNTVRARFDLRPIAELDDAYGWITAGLLPEPWYPDAQKNRRAYRIPAPVETLDPAIAELTADGPFVLMSLGSNVGTVMSKDSQLIPIALEALGSLPIRAVVASDWTGPAPSNVHVVPYVQQRLLLNACDVFVTHAGFSGVREALSAGVPMVAVPLFSDQPENASRVDELGVGVHVDPAGLKPDVLASAIRRVLDEPSFRVAARGFQRRILGLPGLDAFAADVIPLVAKLGGGGVTVGGMDTPKEPGEPPQRPAQPPRLPPPGTPGHEQPTQYPKSPPEFPPGVTPPSPQG